MHGRLSGSMITIAIAASAQAPGVSAAAPAPAVKTPWGEPDLQGIWTDENDTPFQRSPKYADQEFFTEALIRQSAVNAVRPRGGKYDPTPTSHGAGHPPRYNTARMNRHADAEDGALADRCLTPGLPEFGATNGGRSFRRKLLQVRQRKLFTGNVLRHYIKRKLLCSGLPQRAGQLPPAQQ